MTKEYESCPCCNKGDIAVIGGRIVPHERGLGYIPYRLYHRIEDIGHGKPPVRSQMAHNRCPASRKTLEEARKIEIEGKRKAGI